jgi:hypothetical protein
VSSSVQRGTEPDSAPVDLPVSDGAAERRLAVRALILLAVLAVPATAVAGALQGAAGAFGALAGVGLVALLFGGGGLVQSVAVRRGATEMGAVLMAGLGARLLGYLVALVALSQVATLHRPSLALATALGVVVATYYEMRLISRTPQLFWVQARPQRS